MRAPFSRPSALASAGPAGLAERAAPGFPGSPPPHHAPPTPWPPLLSTRAKLPPQPPPDFPTSRPGAWTRTPTRNSPPNRKQEGGSPSLAAPPTGRPQSGSGLRKSRGQFPAAPLLRWSWDLDFQDAGRGRGSAAISGERQVRPRGVAAGADLWLRVRARRILPGLAWKRGGHRSPGAGLEPPRALYLCPRASWETAPAPATDSWWRARVGEVCGPWKLRTISGGKKGVGPHKSPKVKVRVTTTLEGFWLVSSGSHPTLCPSHLLLNSS